MTFPPEPPESPEPPQGRGPSDPYEDADPYVQGRRPGPPDRQRPAQRWRRGRSGPDAAARSAAAARAVSARQRLPGGVAGEGVPEAEVPQRPARTGSSIPGLAALGRAATGQRAGGPGGEQEFPTDVRPFRVIEARPGSGLRPAGTGASQPHPASGPGGVPGSGTVRKILPAGGGAPSGQVEASRAPTGAQPGSAGQGTARAGGDDFGSSRGARPSQAQPLHAHTWGRAGASASESDELPAYGGPGAAGGRESPGPAGGLRRGGTGQGPGSAAGRSGAAGRSSPAGVAGLASLRPPRRSRRDTWSARSGPGGWTKGLVLALVVIVLAGVYVAVQGLRAAPRPTFGATSRVSMVIPGTAPVLPWPTQGEAEVEVAGVGSLGSVGGNVATAIGSVAKIMAAYVILHDHPLSANATGPSIPITQADVATYQADAAQGDSVVPVVAGQSITELAALQALLIPSGDNIAKLLADWDAGSQSAFVAKMNAEAASLGMTHTHYADVSGLSAQTVSTPADQLILAPLAMANPVFAATVAMPEVTLPNVGLVTNYNTILGTDGIIGIKTGSTPSASGCLVFAARHVVGGRTETIYGAVLGAVPTPGQGFIAAATSASKKLVAAVESQVTAVSVLPAGSVEAHVSAPWLRTSVPASTTGAVTLLGWPGLVAHIDVAQSGRLGHSIRSGAAVGKVTVHLGAQSAVTTLRTAGSVAGPSLGWRLTRL